MKQDLNEFNEITNQLNLIDIKFNYDIQTLLILGQDLESWKGIVTLINGSLSKFKLVLSKVVDMIIIRKSRSIKKIFPI